MHEERSVHGGPRNRAELIAVVLCRGWGWQVRFKNRKLSSMMPNLGNQPLVVERRYRVPIDPRDMTAAQGRREGVPMDLPFSVAQPFQMPPACLATVNPCRVVTLSFV